MKKRLSVERRDRSNTESDMDTFTSNSGDKSNIPSPALEETKQEIDCVRDNQAAQQADKWVKLEPISYIGRAISPTCSKGTEKPWKYGCESFAGARICETSLRDRWCGPDGQVTCAAYPGDLQRGSNFGRNTNFSSIVQMSFFDADFTTAHPPHPLDLW